MVAIDWLDRFWSKVCPEPNSGCWLWAASTDKDGYGQVYDHRTRTTGRAHRKAYELAYGVFDLCAVVRHKCDTPSCVNPSHLELGSVQENVDDAVSRGLVPIGEKNGRAKLTKSGVQEIRASSESGPVLARRFKVSRTQIYRVRSRESWGHV